MDDDGTLMTAPETPFVEWGPVELENWLTRGQFSHDVVFKFTQHNITGETLPYLKDEHLKEMEIGVHDRVRLMVEINKLLADKRIVPPGDEQLVKSLLQQLSQVIQSALDQATREINEELSHVRDDFSRSGFNKPLPTPDKNPSSPFNITSPTRPKQTSPSETTTIRKDKHKSLSQRNSTLLSTPNASASNLQSPTMTNMTVQPKPVSEPLKQLRASTDDPCSKILQAAMKRHKLNDDWRNYALVICYGDKERILELDEKPVLIFKELKEKGEHPAIMLRQKADFTVDAGKKLSETPGGKL